MHGSHAAQQPAVDRDESTRDVRGGIRAEIGDDARQLLRRIDASYSGAGRNERRTNWDYERGRRNLAVERWADGEVAAYEGWTPALDAIRVVPGYGKTRTSTDGARIGIFLGVVSMIIGLILLLS